MSIRVHVLVWTNMALLLGLLGAAPALADFCVGNNCGADRPGFHCHSVNPQTGQECWDALDNMCEQVAGFSRTEGAELCGTDIVVPGVAGAIAGQALTAVGGFDTFRTQIRQPAKSKIEQEREEADAEESDEREGIFHFSEITTALEREQWDLAGFEGETTGLRWGWSRQRESGSLFGFSASYQTAEPDQGSSSDLVTATVDYGRAFGGDVTEWKWTVFATGSELSGLLDETLLGGGGRLSITRYHDGGRVLSAGILAQYQTADELDDDVITLGLGGGYGIPIGQRFTLDLEVYGASLLEPSVEDDFFYTAATTFGIYLSPRFTLTVGARTLQGIDDLDSTTFTLGSSTRF